MNIILLLIYIIIIQTTGDFDKICDFYQQNNSNSQKDIPIHLGFIFNDLSSTGSLQNIILINWYLNDFRGNGMFDERYIVYLYIHY